MPARAHDPAVKLALKLKDADFKIERIDPARHSSLIAQVQQNVVVNELGFSEKKDDDYESISARFIAQIADTPIGTLQLLDPQLSHKRIPMPIETFTDITPITKGKPAMEIASFTLLPNYRRRTFCSAMMACCFSYAEQNHIAYTFARTVARTDNLFEKVGLQTVGQPFYDTHTATPIISRVIDVDAGRNLLGDLTKHLREAKIIP